jgi:hypothetical protein
MFFFAEKEGVARLFDIGAGRFRTDVLRGVDRIVGNPPLTGVVAGSIGAWVIHRTGPQLPHSAG